MGIEEISKKEFRKIIEECISGKKDIVRKVGHMEVCKYPPKDFPERVRCRYAEAMYSCSEGNFYLCGKNLVRTYDKNQRLK